jgi:hypothetical protein
LNELKPKLGYNINSDTIIALISNSFRDKNIQLLRATKTVGVNYPMTEFKVIGTAISIYIEPDYYSSRYSQTLIGIIVSIGPISKQNSDEVSKIAAFIENVLTQDHSSE